MFVNTLVCVSVVAHGGAGSVSAQKMVQCAGFPPFTHLLDQFT